MFIITITVEHESTKEDILRTLEHASYDGDITDAFNAWADKHFKLGVEEPDVQVDERPPEVPHE